MSGHRHSIRLLRLAAAAAFVALLAGPAAAQLSMPGIDISPGRASKPMTAEEKEKQKALDDKYKATMQSIPDKKPPADPWGNIRSAPPSAK